MTNDNDLEQQLREHLRLAADSRPAEGALDKVLLTTARIRPRRSFGSSAERLIEAGFVRLGLRLTPAAMRTALALMLLVLVLAATLGVALLGGNRNQPLLVVPTATPSPSPSPVPSQVAAVTPPPPVLTGTFRSPLYHYTIGLASKWTAHPATISIDSGKGTDATVLDLITATGTDTQIQVAASTLGRESFASFLKTIQTAALTDPNTPPGCDGGDPSTWPSVPIGDQQGVWQQMCNYVVAYADVKGKAYQFAWANSTLNTGQHLSIADFKHVLESVVFP